MQLDGTVLGPGDGDWREAATKAAAEGEVALAVGADAGAGGLEGGAGSAAG